MHSNARNQENQDPGASEPGLWSAHPTFPGAPVCRGCTRGIAVHTDGVAGSDPLEESRAGALLASPPHSPPGGAGHLACCGRLRVSPLLSSCPQQLLIALASSVGVNILLASTLHWAAGLAGKTPDASGLMSGTGSPGLAGGGRGMPCTPPPSRDGSQTQESPDHSFPAPGQGGPWGGALGLSLPLWAPSHLAAEGHRAKD
ncbi:uncharacterized protein LOC110350136 [Heterocephalus glaber]|uniref:Uncharacterized protein LOC110350136 n=1 Tax=Heterocephalus glaber TaxID=10181 RepID=A0AAX6T971_HETGA|nr:uncharacterized protein LOC110350136 [Heterocephalus glaber]